MKPVSTAKSYDGVILRQAALIVGFAYLSKTMQRGVRSIKTGTNA